MLEFDTGIGHRALLGGLGVVDISIVLPSCDLNDEGLFAGVRRSRHWVERMPSSNSAIPRRARDEASQRPCIGGLAKRCARRVGLLRGEESFGKRSWLVGVERSDPRTPPARGKLSRTRMIFRASGKWVAGLRSILAMPPRCVPIATPGAAGAKKADRPPLVATTHRSSHALDLGDLSARL
jgi:hypothetical protein